MLDFKKGEVPPIPIPGSWFQEIGIDEVGTYTAHTIPYGRYKVRQTSRGAVAYYRNIKGKLRDNALGGANNNIGPTFVTKNGYGYCSNGVEHRPEGYALIMI